MKWIVTSAEIVQDYESREKETDQFDDECKKAIEERNGARLKKLGRTAKVSTNEYSEKRKMVKRICRRNKRGKGS